jgi:hypothetical protein
MNELLIRSTYEQINAILIKWQFNLNKGKKAYIWTFNLDTDSAVTMLNQKGYKTRIRRKIFLTKDTNVQGIRSYSLEIRKRIWFISTKYKWNGEAAD